jgi:voltage-gated potassium channel
MRYRKRVYEILDVAKSGDNLSRGFDIFIITLIALNIIALNLESVESIEVLYPQIFTIFEYISVIIFSIEYSFRIWSCVENQSYKSPIRGRLHFAITPLALIDLFAILPFYIPFVGFDLRFLRVVRLMRIARIAKVGRYSKSIQTLQRVLGAKKEQLVSAVFILLLLLIMASSMMYFAEKDIQPERFSSIPASMWWAVATLTTVGYGDVYPVTQLGKLMASVIAILGIGMFALPTGIIGAGFVEEIERNKSEPRICPKCGTRI